MKTRSVLSWLAPAVASVAMAGSAQALSVAGWDFSQYLGDGLLTIDGATGADTLSANYSNLDPTFNAGAESAAFGTMYIDGAFGSSTVDPFGATPELLPTAGSLASNLNAPVQQPGDNPFDSATILLSEGQIFANLQAMTAASAVSVVFSADLTSIPEFGQDWSLSFGAKTFSGTSTIGVEYSIDGSTYLPVGSVNVDTNDTPFLVPLPSGATDTAFVRLSFVTTNGQAILDNLSIDATIVPEPGTALLLIGGLAGLARYGRRRA